MRFKSLSKFWLLKAGDTKKGLVGEELQQRVLDCIGVYATIPVQVFFHSGRKNADH
jgi:hypothetical protein